MAFNLLLFKLRKTLCQRHSNVLVKRNITDGDTDRCDRRDKVCIQSFIVYAFLHRVRGSAASSKGASA